MRTIDIDRLPSLEGLLAREITCDLRKVIIEVIKSATDSAKDYIVRKLIFLLTLLEDARIEYTDYIEEGGEI